MQSQNQKNKDQKGFSLVELLIVVAIIGIIAAIAIPSLLSARKASNESAAIGTLRTMGSAEATALSLQGTYLNIAGLASATYIDNAWTEGGVRDSYAFTSGTVTSTQFQIISTRTDTNASGTRDFNEVEDYVIRTGSTAGSGTPIGQGASGS